MTGLESTNHDITTHWNATYGNQMKRFLISTAHLLVFATVAVASIPAPPNVDESTVPVGTSVISNMLLAQAEYSQLQDTVKSSDSAALLSFEEIVKLYEQGSFQEALPYLQAINTEDATLFLGKSYFALGHVGAARQVLRPLLESKDDAVRREAVYTLALVHFQAENYAQSLELLLSLSRETRRTAIQIDAERLYRQILNYLSPGERFATLGLLHSLDIKADLVESGHRWMSTPEYQILERTFLSEFPDSTTSTRWKELLRRNTLNTTQGRFPYPPAPEGIVYQIGVLLPVFAPDDPRFSIPRNLYHGLTHAAEQFNATNSRKKVHLHFQPSYMDSDSVQYSFLDLVYTHQADVIVGPLFSGPASVISSLAEEHQVPLVLPLANADQINAGHNYTFQINPTFEVHGKQMARYAIQNLGLDSLAVISQKSSLGESAANAFRYEAEALGATISYWFEEDFRAKGFDLSAFTDPFTTDSVLVDSLGYRPVHAVYAPFTGQEAATLSRLLANDVELHNKEIVILGLEEWKNTALTPWQMNQLEIYYSEPFRVQPDSSLSAELSQRFGSEPDLFTFIGYDTGVYLLNSLDRAGNPHYLKEVLKTMGAKDGAAVQIDFSDQRTNQQVYITPLTDMAKETVDPSHTEPGETPNDSPREALDESPSEKPGESPSETPIETPDESGSGGQNDPKDDIESNPEPF